MDTHSLETGGTIDREHDSGGWTNDQAGLGAGGRLAQTRYVPPRPREITELESLFRYVGIAGRIVSREPDDATKNGFVIEGIDERAQVRTQDYLEEMAYLTHLADGKRWGRLYGRAATLINVDDGRPAWAPVDRANIRDIPSMIDLDGREVSVMAWDDDPMSRTFGGPLILQIGSSRHHTVQHAHIDRVLWHAGTPTPPSLEQQNQGGGDSVLQPVWESLRNWGLAHSASVEMMIQLTVGTLKISGLAEALEGKNWEMVVDRLKGILQGLSITGDMVLDADSENYEVVTRTLAGVKDALEAHTTQLVSSQDQPRSIVMGETPGGLNSGENAGELQSWYSHVTGRQTRDYTPPTRKFLDLAFASLTGPTFGIPPERYAIRWNPLWVSSEKEIADTEFAEANAAQLNRKNGFITANEGRQRPGLKEHYGITEQSEAEAKGSLDPLDERGVESPGDGGMIELPAI